MRHRLAFNGAPSSFQKTRSELIATIKRLKFCAEWGHPEKKIVEATGICVYCGLDSRNHRLNVAAAAAEKESGK